MKNILLRATANPLKNASYYEALTGNLLGNNSGNMLFPFSIMKALWTTETQLSIESQFGHSEEEIDRINEEQDCYVISLANAFRPDFVSSLNKMTDTVRKLKIPCIVIGVGLQASYEPDLKTAHPFDDAAKRFCAAVLEKSVSIGVRGEITAAYLKSLGFASSQIDVIGCPSVFLYGNQLPFRADKELSAESRISVNVSSGMPYKFLEFLERTIPLFPNYHFVPQENKELELMYAGVPFPQRFQGQNLFPNDLTREVYAQDRARFFVNVPSWLEYMKQIDFSFGTRIHGNIAAVLGGVPTFIFAADSRVRELAEYHNIPNMPIQKVTDQTDIQKIYEKTDFQTVQKGHADRFHHYLSYLEANGLPHISEENWNDAPFTQAIAQISWEGPLHTITSVSKEEQAERLTLYGNYCREKNKKREKELQSCQARLKKLKETGKQKGAANQKSGYWKKITNLFHPQ